MFSRAPPRVQFMPMTRNIIYIRSVARKETLDVHQKNWVCHMYCQMNAQKKKIKKHAYWVLIS